MLKVAKLCFYKNVHRYDSKWTVDSLKTNKKAPWVTRGFRCSSAAIMLAGLDSGRTGAFFALADFELNCLAFLQ